jgi:murein DD-endopeptidase MepM/ murein hydrolase activator NlpD
VGHGYYKEKILYAQYGHLGKLFVSVGDKVKRGQVLGLAAPTPERFKRIKTFEPHLHFALFQMKPGFRVGERRNFLIMKRRGDALITKTPFNPDDFWLGGKPQCFDPTKDYTQYKDFEFSHPVACGKSRGR